MSLILLAGVCREDPARSQSKPPSSSVRRTLDLEKRTRTFWVHAPTDMPTGKSIPLVFVFHGGGGDGAGMEKLTRFSELADRERFIAVYPDGVAKHWNDGRDPVVSEAHRNETDDIGFVEAMLADMGKDYAINPRRIYATGISNGAIFSHYLAAKLSQRIAAIAPVVGGLAHPFAEKFEPGAPVSVLVIQGTDDPLMPYHGGGVLKGRNGRIVDTDTAVQLWTRRDGCEQEPVTGELEDADPKDNCRVKWFRWTGGKNGTEVVLYKIEGGGHTWPGGPQYLPPYAIGRVCRDFDATAAIWEFFKKHPKP